MDLKTLEERINANRGASVPLKPVSGQGTLAEALDRLAGGPFTRHCARVNAALSAAWPMDWPTVPAALAALAALTLDVIGVGGTADVEGWATERHPALSDLGKGRKQASDGPAWSSAIDQACEEVKAVLDGLAPRLVIDPETGAMTLVSGSETVDIGPRRWARALIARVAQGKTPWPCQASLEDLERSWAYYAQDQEQ